MFAGLDVGTTAVKFSIFSEQLSTVEEKSMIHGAYKTGRFDFATVLEASKETIRACSTFGRRVEALAISTVGELMEPLGPQGEILSSSLNGGRQDDLQWLNLRFSNRQLFEMTGLLPQPRFASVGLARRLREKVPQGNARFSLLEDYLVHALTGEYAVSQSSAARTMLLNRKTGDWDEELLLLLQVDKSQLPSVLKSGRTIAKIKAELAQELGLCEGTKIVAGGHDQFCNGLGASLLSAGNYVNCSGTVESIGLFTAPPDTQLAYERQMQLCPGYTDGEIFTFYAPVRSCGTLDDYMRKHGENEAAKARALGIHPNTYVERSCSASPASVLTIPYFQGRGYPNPDPRKRPVMLGGKPDTPLAEIWQSILEGIAFEVRSCLEIYRQSGITRKGVCAVGGGAQSKYWMQLKADVYGCPVATLAQSQAGTLGAALLAGRSQGAYMDSSNRVYTGHVFMPDPIRSRQYTQKYQQYRDLLLELEQRNES